jgi:hypothetical protein
MSPLFSSYQAHGLITLLTYSFYYKFHMINIQWNSSKESYYLCENDYETEEEARAQQMMNEWRKYSMKYKEDLFLTM